MVRNRSLAVLLAVLVVTTVGVRAAPAADNVMDLIPPDAWGAVILRDIGNINKDIVDVAQMLQVPMGPKQMVPDPLSMIKEQLQISEGLDEKGSAALVVLEPSDVSEEGLAKAVALLIPCTDPKQFLDQLALEESTMTEETKLPQGVLSIEMAGTPSYGAVKGQYAVVGPTPEAVEKMLKAKGSMKSALSPERLAMFEKKLDGLVWINMTKVGPATKGPVMETLQGILMFAAMANPAMGGQLEQALKQIELLFDETASVQLGVALDKAGVAVDFHVQAKSDSSIAKAIAGWKTKDGSLLTGLPVEPWMLLVGGVGSSSKEKIEQSKEGLDAVLSSPMIQQYVDEKKLVEFKTVLEALLELSGSMEAGAFSISRLPGGDAGMIGATAVYTTPGVATKALPLVRKLIKTGLAMVTDEEVRVVLDAVVYTDEAEKAAGATVDTIALDLTKLPKADEDKIEKVTKVLGKEGIMCRLAALDEDHMAFFFAGGPERVVKVAELSAKKASPLGESDAIKAVSEQLPAKNRMFEMYIALDTILQFVNDVSVAVGERKPIMADIPNFGAPSLSIVGTTSKDTMQIHLFVPTKVIVGTKDIITKTIAAQAMRGMQTEEPAEDDNGSEEEEAPSPGGLK